MNEASSLKLNLGCGHNRLAGFVNVDAAPACAPDQVFDLEQTPWPWASDSVSEVALIHALEHMGGDPKIFLAIMQELYRVLIPGGMARIHVPHPRHDDFLNDPTHVRPITPALLSLFDKDLNDRWKAQGGANTPLAHYTGVDFKITGYRAILAEPYASQFKAGEITREQLNAWGQERNNVVSEYQIELAARKPPP